MNRYLFLLVTLVALVLLNVSLAFTQTKDTERLLYLDYLERDNARLEEELNAARDDLNKLSHTYAKGKLSITPYVGMVAGTMKDMLNKTFGENTTGGNVTFSDGSQVTDPFEANIEITTFENLYNIPFIAGFDIGYTPYRETEFFGGLRFKIAKANDTHEIERVAQEFVFTNPANVATTIQANDSIHTAMGDYNSWSLRIGFNKHFYSHEQNENRVRLVKRRSFYNYIARKFDLSTFIGGFIGYEHINEIKGTLKFIEAEQRESRNVETGGILFYGATDQLMFGGQGGINKGLSWLNANLGLRAGFEYSPSLVDSDNDLSLINLNSANDHVGDGIDFNFSASFNANF